VLAVAATNPILRAKLSDSLRARRRMLRTVLADVAHRLPSDVRLNVDFVATIMFNINWMFNDLMGEDAVTNDEYSALLRRLLVSRA
jgi:hypothetical protein